MILQLLSLNKETYTVIGLGAYVKSVGVQQTFTACLDNKVYGWKEHLLPGIKSMIYFIVLTWNCVLNLAM